jgi:xanthine dehydrogenase YagR molybdenum-binding subunit
VRLSLTAQGRVRVEMAALDVGNGTYTVIAQVAADRLGVAIDDIDVQLGDSDLPAAGYAAGSKHCASVSNAVAKGCEQLRARIAQAATGASDGVFAGRDPATLQLRDGTLRGADGQTEALDKAVTRAGGRLEVYAEHIPAGAPADGVATTWQGRPATIAGTRLPHEIRAAFGAQFVEVRVHARTREIRVVRALGAYAAGTIINPVTARSQLMGGMIWGISAALFEQTELDLKRGTYVNDELGEYLVPVNADIGSIEVLMLPERDAAINELGVKGIGELGIIGMNAAVANAVYHATGIRVRDLPLRIDQLL